MYVLILKENVSTGAGFFLTSTLENYAAIDSLIESLETSNLLTRVLARILNLGAKKLAILKYLGNLFFKEDAKLLKLQP